MLTNGTSLSWGVWIRELLCGVLNPKDNGFPVSSQKPSCVSEKGGCLPSHQIHHLGNVLALVCNFNLRGRLLTLLENKMIVLLCLPVKSSSPVCGQGLTADVCSIKTPGAIPLPHILLV